MSVEPRDLARFCKETFERVLWFLFCLFVFIMLMSLLVSNGYCQKNDHPHLGLHKDRMDQEDTGGWMYVVVTGKKEDLVYFYREGKDLIESTSMGWDEDSLLVDDTKVKFTGCYLMLYCRKHLYIYVLARGPCESSPGVVKFVKP